MAIRDTSKKPYIEDNDNNIFIGIDLPIRKSNGKEGFFASTTTTIEAVKNNIRNLLNTHQGERLMQPNLGLNLRKYLFNPINDEIVFTIQEEILDIFEAWLPFVMIRNIRVKTALEDTGVDSNTLLINIDFSIEQDPDTLDSVQVTITDTNQPSTDNGASGGGY